MICYRTKIVYNHCTRTLQLHVPINCFNKLVLLASSNSPRFKITDFTCLSFVHLTCCWLLISVIFPPCAVISCFKFSCPLSKFSRVLAMSYLQSSAVISWIPAFWAKVSKHCRDLLACWLLFGSLVSRWVVDSGSWVVDSSSLLLNFCFVEELVFVESFKGSFCWLSACWRLS